ncbi:MAG: hypothetical protein ABSG68_26080, partial [Thermoguttaceae bacterium]
IPKEKLVRPLPLERPSDVFSYTSFRGSFFEPRLHLRFETALSHHRLACSCALVISGEPAVPLSESVAVGVMVLVPFALPFS